ncbi:MAG: hypothetical protein LQ337_007032 [Flavoplaca oasis]|nr:MAG: hypothetical protein LQ337_007032 [Flavoplaca oasis]
MEHITESQMDEEALTADQHGDTASTSPSSSATELSRVWSGMPCELVCMVVERSDRETLYNWTHTSKFYYNVAADVIWESFEVCDPKPSKAWYRINALRPKLRFQAKLPAERVKKFIFYASQADSRPPFALERRFATHCMMYALRLLPNLQHLALEGDVHPNGFSAIRQYKNLTTLELRLSFQFLPFDDGDLEEPSCSYTLNFAPLAGLAHLHSLMIGRLTPREAPGLAIAVQNLPLVNLKVSAMPPAGSDDPRNSYAGTEIESSPIQSFLEKVLAAEEGVTGHLPLSLQDIDIEDFYRPFTSSNENLLLETIGPAKPTKLKLRIRATTQLVHFFRHTQLPGLTSFDVCGCRHILPDAAWKALGLNVNGKAPIHPPQIPVGGSFFQFLSRHRHSLELVRITIVVLPGRPGGLLSLRFGKYELACLEGLRQPLGLEIEKSVERDRCNPIWNRVVWSQKWIHRCSQPYRNEAGFSSCLGVRMEHSVTMGFIETQDEILNEEGDEDGEEEEEEDEEEEDEEEEADEEAE